MARENLPFLQFYVGDWFKDPGIQMLDATERGIWLHMIFLMWEGKDKGRLTLNSKPYPIEGIAAQLRISSNVVISTIGKIIDYGIGDIDANGVLSNRRMLRDYALREQARINGMKGGNPHLKKKEASLPLTRDEMSRTEKPKKAKETKEIAIPKYQQADRDGNPRSKLRGFDNIWLSSAELDRLKAECDRLQLSKEQRRLAVEKVDVWFAENPKKLATSSEHITRILDWGIKAALEMQTTEAKAKRAKKVEDAQLPERKEFLTAAEKRKRAHEKLRQEMANAEYVGFGRIETRDDAESNDRTANATPCALLD